MTIKTRKAPRYVAQFNDGFQIRYFREIRIPINVAWRLIDQNKKTVASGFSDSKERALVNARSASNKMAVPMSAPLVSSRKPLSSHVRALLHKQMIEFNVTEYDELVRAVRHKRQMHWESLTFETVPAIAVNSNERLQRLTGTH